MIKNKFTDNANSVINFVAEKLPNSTYISALLFKEDKLILSMNNNYNKWSENYTSLDMDNDEVFYLISHTRLKESGCSVCFWNFTYHETEASYKIHKKREKFGLYNGVTILAKFNDEYNIGLNVTSNSMINENVFYSKVLLKKDRFIDYFKSLLH